MQQAFGVSFDDVRVHDDTPAQRLASALGAAAVTAGRDVAFAAGAYSPQSPSGNERLAHELAHVAQNKLFGTAGDKNSVSRPSASAEAEAARVAPRAARGERVEVEARPGARFMRSFGNFVDEYTPDVVKDAGRWAGDKARAVGEDAADLAGEGLDIAGQALDKTLESVEDLAELGADQLEALARKAAPELMELLDGPISFVREILCERTGELLRAALSDFTIVGQIKPFFDMLGGFAEKLTGIPKYLKDNASAFFGDALRPFIGVLDKWINPGLEGLQDLIESFQTKRDELLGWVFGKAEAEGGPILEWVWDIARSAWGWVSGLLSNLGPVWGWIKGAFGVAWGGVEDVVSWMMDSAKSAWKEVHRWLAPVREAISGMGEAFDAATEDGPIFGVASDLAEVWQFLTEYVSNNDFETILEDMIGFYTDVVFPALIDKAQMAARAMSVAVGVINRTVSSISKSAATLGGFPLAACLDVLSVGLEFVQRELEQFAKLTDRNVAELGDSIATIMRAMAELLKPILDFAVRLVMVIANPFMLPVAITAGIWLLLPPDLKPPVIDFIVNVLLVAAKAMPDSMLLAGLISGAGPLIVLVRAMVIGFFERVKNARDGDRKVAASNKIANILAGGGIEFATGLLVGIVVGLWEGLTDPFILLYQLGKLVVWLFKRILGFEPGEKKAQDAQGPANTSEEEQKTEPDKRAEAAWAELGSVFSEFEGTDEQIEGAAKDASSTEGLSAGRVLQLLGKAVDALVEGAGAIGAKLAAALFGFLEKSDYALGRMLGWLAGTILFEVVLGYLTAGGYTAISASRPIIKWMVKVVVKVNQFPDAVLKKLAPIGKSLVKGLDAVMGVLGSIPGVGPLIRKVQKGLRKLLRFGDEAAETAAKRGDGVVGEAGEQAAKRGDDAAASAGAKGARHTDEAAREQGEALADDILDEGGETAGRKSGRPDIDGGDKATEYPIAMAAARRIVDIDDARNVDVLVMRAHLAVVAQRFAWLKRFEVLPTGGADIYEVIMRASKNVVDRRVDLHKERQAKIDELDQKDTLTEGEKRALAQLKRRQETAGVELDALRKRQARGQTLKGAELARLKGYRNAPDGYVWKRSKSGEPTIVRAPGSKQMGKPKLAYDPDSRTFEVVKEKQVVPANVSSKQRQVLTSEDYDIPDDVRERFEELLSKREKARLNRDVAEAMSELRGKVLRERIDALSSAYGVPNDVGKQLKDLLAANKSNQKLRDGLLDFLGDDATHRKLGDRLSSLRGDVSRYSEKLGEESAEQWARRDAMEWLQDRDIVADPSKYKSPEKVFGKVDEAGVAGEFDQVWKIEPKDGGEPVYVVIEAKGGSARRGTKMVDSKAHEQGTAKYFTAMIGEMKQKGGKAKETALELEAARGFAPDKVRYVQVSTPIRSKSGVPVVKDRFVEEFEP